MIEKINVDEELRSIENCLRDNIIYVLKDNYGKDYEKNYGVSQERIEQWKQRKNEESKKLNNKTLDDRLLYYADFYDLKTIIDKNWQCFKEIFDEKRKIDYMLDTLDTFRNPNAHNRDLMEYQKHLLIGIGGEIKMSIMNYSSSKENEDKYFPKITSLQINGLSYEKRLAFFSLENAFHYGDLIEIKIFSLIPPGYQISYKVHINHKKYLDEYNNDKILIELDDKFKIGRNTIDIKMTSDREFHKFTGYDDYVSISFMIFPN